MAAYKDALRDTPLSGNNAAFVEMLYDRYLEAPESVPEGWCRYFASLGANGAEVAHGRIVEEIALRAKHRRATAPAALEAASTEAPADAMDAGRLLAVHRLVTTYRQIGARCAAVNPLGYADQTQQYSDHLSLKQFGLTESDLAKRFRSDFTDLPETTLGGMIEALKQTYCGPLTVEYEHITDVAQRRWIRERFESIRSTPAYSPGKRREILRSLTAGEQFEQYLHTKYVGQKRFSLEGGEVLIPMMNELIDLAAEAGTLETVIGMAHRGRLNVLVNTLGKLPSELFSEFEGRHELRGSSSGDVKYHMGFSSTLRSDKGQMHLVLAFNPSHLEIVDPVVEGSVRARQDRRKDTTRRQVLPVLVHGDAAFAGQGVVMETLNLSQTRGYQTGGTVHFIINNQIGFTTSSPNDARSTFFCTDVAKMVEIPIIHVNGDEPDACVLATEIAYEFRQKFSKDVVVDIVCYRRLGHNEQDEPMVTQPLMYKRIRDLKTTRVLYAERLAAEGAADKKLAQKMVADVRKQLDSKQSTNPRVVPTDKSLFVNWKSFEPDVGKADTGYDRERLCELGRKIAAIPAGFEPHSRLKRVIDARLDMANGKAPIDWGMAENLSYATLLDEGHSVRLSGQDCGRGTFFHRHAVWHDQKRDKRDGGAYVPLRNISDEQGNFLVIDSLLSEEAVLGFEYGYATTSPDTLVVWEAQFGDFANGAQVVIDQFIAAGQSKWGRLCGLTMLLPHGYEGQGPEHSSARLERYLQLCAEANMSVCVPSAPAQVFHMLRRQIHQRTRRPLIVFSPKSLLRHKDAASSLDDLADGSFRLVIPETQDIDLKKVGRVIVCSGKIYYELVDARAEAGIENVAIVRLEQLYPYPEEELKEVVAQYPNASELLWCQEEPRNQGAWLRLRGLFSRTLSPKQTLLVSMRPSSASPATGRPQKHKDEQSGLVRAALGVGGAVAQSTAAVALAATKRKNRKDRK